jgi:lipoprotein-anchoring transpeptidase ErfK/SrfK
MMISRTVLLFFIYLLLVGCKGATSSNPNFLNDNSLSLPEKIELFLKDEGLMKKLFNQEESQLLKGFYKERKYKPILYNEKPMLSNAGKITLQLLDNSLAFGVPKEFIGSHSKNIHPVKKDLIAVLNIARLIEYRDHGFTQTDGSVRKKCTTTDASALKKCTSFSDWKLASDFMLARGPIKDILFNDLSNLIYNYAVRYKIDTLNSNPKDFKSEDKRKEFMKASLVAKGYVSESDNTNELWDRTLLAFKLDNGLDSSNQINDFTIEALCESNKSRLTRAALSLEKVRKRIIGKKKFVWINIPEYHLYFYANDSLKARHRVVTGKRGNETPELVSEIRNIIIMPDWHVPASIVKREIMPKVRKNHAYLSKNHYVIRRFNDTTPVNLETANLKSNGFSILQRPGKWNSLGVIKFEFNNNHSVYVHDTPQKGLFQRTVRSYSHGCIRCEKPVELGKLMIKYDQVGRKRYSVACDTIDSLATIYKHRNIPLIKRIPIFVVYQTVTSQRGKLVFHLDIYGRDQTFLQQLASAGKNFNFNA